MAQPQLGKLERKDPREIWQREAQEFTPWLADNLVLLNEALGLDIELIQTEMPVGEFAVPLVLGGNGLSRPWKPAYIVGAHIAFYPVLRLN